MRHWITLSLCLLFASWAHATNYYIAANGNDSNHGRSPNSPWKSLAKVNAMMSSFRPGDGIFLRQGDTFTGELLVRASGSPGSPIRFTSYGSGEKPIIDGFERITGWTSVGNSVWKARYDSPHQRAANLYVDGTFEPIGRYPNEDQENAGYLTITGGNGRNEFISSDLQGGSWKGADAVVRSSRWALGRKEITQHSGNRILVNEKTYYTGTKGFGFFIVNHRNALDQEGEWAHHKNSKEMFLRSSANPNSRTVMTARAKNLVSMERVHDITLENLTLRGSVEHTVYLWNSNNITINACSLYGSGHDAVLMHHSKNAKLKNSTIDQTNNNAITVEQGGPTEITNNSILRTGSIAGMGDDANGSYFGISANTNNITIQNNRIDQVGYNGIGFWGDHVVIKNNSVTNFCTVKDDGAGIYTWIGTPTIRQRVEIIGNVVGDGNLKRVGLGTPHPERVHVSGIYLDSHSNNVTIDDNTVYNCGNFGIFLHNTKNDRVRNNNLYDNHIGIGFIQDNKSNGQFPIRDLLVQNNAIFARQADQRILHFSSIRDDHKEIGTLTGNHYFSPLNQERIIQVTDKNYRSVFYTLSQWQNNTPHDGSTRTDTKLWPAKVIKDYLSGNLLENGSFDGSTEGWHAWARKNNAKIEHQKGTLDGGSMALRFTSQRGGDAAMAASLDKGTGPLRKGEELVLHYSIKSTGINADIEMQLTSKGGAFTLLSDRKYVAPDPQRQEKEEFFQVNNSATNGDLKFVMEETTQTVNLDNISLRKVSTQPVNHDDLVRFFVNPSDKKASFSVPQGQWQSIRGEDYSGAVTLEPYQSIILIRSDGQPSPAPADQPTTGGSIAEGVYEFRPVSATNQIMEVYRERKYDRANVNQSKDKDGTHQRWRVSSAGDGFYRISPLHAPQYALEMNMSDRKSATPNVQIKSYDGGTNQLWKVVPVKGKRYYTLVPKSTTSINRKLQLAVASANSGNHINIVVAPPSHATTQQWALERVSDHARTADASDKPTLTEDELVASFEVYPNPLSSGDLTVTLDPEATETEVRVFDMAGRLLLHEYSSGKEAITFSREALGSGVRVIKAVSDDHTMVKRVVVE